jgi:hypothetical protein
MNILLGLSPFIVFFVLMRLATPLPALAAAFAVSAILVARDWRRGSAKILEAGSLALFGALTLYTAAASPDWSIAGVRLAVDGGLAVIVAVSLAIRRPFTLQYARERVAQQFWNSPIFIRTNDLISAVWLAAFLVLSGCDAAAVYLPALPLWFLVAATIAAIAGAAWFSIWYPAKVRRKVQATYGVST